ncbi:MAG: HAD family hydrolase [Ruminococcaceae bacterium]|nr:HAD family hydrolase [Oscillospiraceae bacterium]
MKYDVVLWDFDGTLVDTSEGIFESLRIAFARMGQSMPELPILRKFIGPPMLYSFQTFVDFTPKQAEEGVRRFREDYETRGIYNARVYDGLKELNMQLRSEGIKIGVATLKPERMAKLLLAHFGLDALIDVCVGTDGDESSDITKAGIILEAMQRLGCRDKSRAVLIGDTIYDAVGAKEAGIDFLAAAYGFGIDEERDRQSSIGLAHNAEEISVILRKL